MKRPYLSLIQEAGIQCGIQFIEIAPNVLYEVKKDGTSFLMNDVDLGLNQTSSASIANSKSLTYTMLSRTGVPCIEHFFLLHPRSRYAYEDTYKKAEGIYRTFGPLLVLKPDEGKQGNDVMKCHSLEELYSLMDALFAKNVNITISPYYEAKHEYRLVVLNEAVKLIFAKEKIRSWKHNLTGGGAIVKEIDFLTNNEIEKLHKIAIQAAKALQLTFCTVDVLSTTQGFKVLEVNASVYLSEYMKTDEHARQRVLEVFKDAFTYKFQNLN